MGVVNGGARRISLQLGIETIKRRKLPSVIRQDLAAAVHHHGGAGGREPQKIHFGHQPAEKRENVAKAVSTGRVGGRGIVDGAVAKAQNHRLFRNTKLEGVTKPVCIFVIEHTSLQTSEPVESGHVTEGYCCRIRHDDLA